MRITTQRLSRLGYPPPLECVCIDPCGFVKRASRTTGEKYYVCVAYVCKKERGRERGFSLPTPLSLSSLSFFLSPSPLAGLSVRMYRERGHNASRACQCGEEAIQCTICHRPPWAAAACSVTKRTGAQFLIPASSATLRVCLLPCCEGFSLLLVSVIPGEFSPALRSSPRQRAELCLTADSIFSRRLHKQTDKKTFQIPLHSFASRCCVSCF